MLYCAGVMGVVGIEFVEVLGVTGTKDADGEYDILDGVTGSDPCPGTERRDGMGRELEAGVDARVCEHE